eukprot:3481668-Pyramimonas_sp.AAC.1
MTREHIRANALKLIVAVVVAAVVAAAVFFGPPWPSHCQTVAQYDELVLGGRPQNAGPVSSMARKEEQLGDAKAWCRLRRHWR